MLHHEKAIQQFVDSYRERPGTIGVFWGGSSCERTPEAFSDVDLFVVTEDYVPREAGMSQVYGVTLDYFVNPISRIKQQMEQEIEAIHDYWAIKIYAFSKLLLDVDGQALSLQHKAQELFDTPFPPPDSNENMTNHNFVFDSFQEYLKHRHLNLQWRMAYYACLQSILHAVCYQEGVPFVPWLKAERLLKDEGYRTAYHLKSLPSEPFCSMFLNCLEEAPAEEMQENLTKLYQLCMKGSQFDADNYHIYK